MSASVIKEFPRNSLCIYNKCFIAFDSESSFFNITSNTSNVFIFLELVTGCNKWIFLGFNTYFHNLCKPYEDKI